MMNICERETNLAARSHTSTVASVHIIHHECNSTLVCKEVKYAGARAPYHKAGGQEPGRRPERETQPPESPNAVCGYEKSSQLRVVRGTRNRKAVLP